MFEETLNDIFHPSGELTKRVMQHLLWLISRDWQPKCDVSEAPLGAHLLWNAEDPLIFWGFMYGKRQCFCPILLRKGRD